MRTSLLILQFALLLGGCTTLPPRSNAYTAPHELAQFQQEELSEISGIAPSGHAPHVYWVHNDSGDTARIFAVNDQGQLLGIVNLDGIDARDCEDIDVFQHEGRSWIMLADIGDNDAVRDDLRFYFLPEPDPSTFSLDHPLHVKPAYVWSVAFVDGARDCEGVTVAEQSHEILLISKRTEPPVLYSLPFEQGPATVAISDLHVAQRIMPLSSIEPPTAAERALPGRLGQYRSQVSAFDLSSDNTLAAVLTYGNIWVYQKRSDEPWTAAFARNPARVPVQKLIQAEALCFAANSHDLIVTSERLPAPLQIYPAK